MRYKKYLTEIDKMTDEEVCIEWKVNERADIVDDIKEAIIELEDQFYEASEYEDEMAAYWKKEEEDCNYYRVQLENAS